MKTRVAIVGFGTMVLAQIAWANPIPWPPPASMPLEEMWVDIQATEDRLYATFAGDFTFDYIPSDVATMMFPVPVGASNIRVRQDHSTDLPWSWSDESYPTVFQECPSLPMVEWAGPFPENGAVFTVEYEHDLIWRWYTFAPEAMFVYALGTGKYFDTYDKTTTAIFDISLPLFAGFVFGGVWLDHTPLDPSAYELVGSELSMTLTSQFGPFTRDLVVSLVGPFPFRGDLNRDGSVGQPDLDLVLGQWGNSGGAITDPRADANHDDFVGQADLDYVLSDWGRGTPPVPEPITLWLLALGGLAMIRRRKRSTRPANKMGVLL